MTSNESQKSEGQKQLEALYGYELPVQKEEFVDIEKKSVVDKKDISPLEIIKAVANKNGIKLYLGATGCKYCYDRKYIGFDSLTHAPIPCSCLYRGRSSEEKRNDAVAFNTHTFNREKKRQMKKGLKKFLKMNKIQKSNLSETVNVSGADIPQSMSANSEELVCTGEQKETI
jgi:hypothetical protein